MREETFPGDIAQYFSVIHRAFLKDTKGEYAKYDLNPTNAYILLYLFFNKNSSQSELAQKLVINKGQITRETTKLLSLNFISKEISSKNRTTNVIAISSDGKKVIKKIIDIRNQWWEEKLKLSGVKTNSEFLDSLKKLESILN
ncbi:MarR family winged helix-turn-helix transcriptional regulator [Oenococcus oeni]|uniref:HTH-type transcriptional regulator SarZ n=23 Tax=Oenococcus oeni TaxID=1247 RepID=Q04D66_OENOB|nr:MarR family transcriptional regulator [Oenococcus oeni]KGO16801.1 MarR family transcriptional regulator [Oenococcus oeni X2L]ABJ57606.1 transcriptional regulator, MarR family [Oenococcus oeni PSU-1]EFD87665.1 hypothetical protein AWRIB429_1807 [Oenococcus oeni AWRIB429]EJN92575.1 MarR family transcriptional regulator [Oenococcus oeni AWRIB304]EJO01045.1 MarR family transcriptional regulator [Oenococcus oeni AWRIB318]